MVEYFKTKLYLKRRNQLEILNSPDKYCSVCFHKLVKKKSGMVCKNWKCPIYWKFRGFAWNDSPENIKFMERVKLRKQEKIENDK